MIEGKTNENEEIDFDQPVAIKHPGIGYPPQRYGEPGNENMDWY
jgi:hypothetical protein